jgi:hypothetical protein
MLSGAVWLFEMLHWRGVVGDGSQPGSIIFCGTLVITVVRQQTPFRALAPSKLGLVLVHMYISREAREWDQG